MALSGYYPDNHIRMEALSPTILGLFIYPLTTKNEQGYYALPLQRGRCPPLIAGTGVLSNIALVNPLGPICILPTRSYIALCGCRWHRDYSRRLPVGTCNFTRGGRRRYADHRFIEFLAKLDANFLTPRWGFDPSPCFLRV